MRGEHCPHPPEMGAVTSRSEGSPRASSTPREQGAPCWGQESGCGGFCPPPGTGWPPDPLRLGVGIMAPAGLHPSGQRCWGTGLWPCMPHLGCLEAPSHTGATRLRQGRGTLNVRRRTVSVFSLGSTGRPGRPQDCPERSAVGAPELPRSSSDSLRATRADSAVSLLSTPWRCEVGIPPPHLAGRPESERGRPPQGRQVSGRSAGPHVRLASTAPVLERGWGVPGRGSHTSGRALCGPRPARSSPPRPR